MATLLSKLLWRDTRVMSPSTINLINVGRFSDLDAEEVERCVEKYYTAINKAAKFFAKADVKEQR